MKKKFIVLFLMLSIAVSQYSFSQNDTTVHKTQNEIIKNSVDKLQQKILLTNDQNSRIEQMLSTYLKVNTFITNKAEILDKIEKLLTDRQKVKFSIVKEEWWGNFIKFLKE